MFAFILPIFTAVSKTFFPFSLASRITLHTYNITSYHNPFSSQNVKFLPLLARLDINISAAKARTKYWEPTLRLACIPHKDGSGTRDTKEHQTYMKTCNAFDPSVSRPFSLRSIALPLYSLSTDVKGGKYEFQRGAYSSM